ncbi:hypothetical protein A4G19_05745 [Pasteurellaceae bacterium Macca]|nr:hypothetical protein [Pasteurellaceae bacterium Macca]
MKKYALLALLVAPTFAVADESCEHFKTSYDRTYCSAKSLIESDKALKKVYNKLKSQLNSELSKGLIQAQKDWIRHRDLACENNNGNLDVDCNFRINRERTDYLRDRLRECQAGRCQIHAITKQSWYTY